MNWKTSFLIFLLILSSSTPVNRVAANAQAPQLWAAVVVSDPLFRESWNVNLMMHFTIVNDGSETIDPKIELSKIIINGEALKDSAFIFSNGPRPLNWNALAPGDALRFSFGLSDYFKEPGVYKVSWKGENFEAQPTVFRVIPIKEIAPEARPAKQP